MAVHSLSEIRKISNRPFSFLGLSSSEFSLIMTFTSVGFLAGVVIQFVVNMVTTEGEPPFVLYPTMGLFVILAMVVIYVSNKLYGQGVIFYILPDRFDFQRSFKKIKPKFLRMIQYKKI